MSARRIFVLGLGTLCVAGCLSPVRQDVDALVCKRAELSLDEPPPGFLPPPNETKPLPPCEKRKPATLLDRLKVPEGVPGSEAPLLSMPKDYLNPKLSQKQKEALLVPVVAKHFPAQMEVGPDPQPVPGPDGRPLTPADLQRLAREHSPLLRQAASDIKAAEGVMIQVAVYNNPVIGYSSAAESFTNGSIMGPFSVGQTIVTMGKRKLAQAAAKMDLDNAKLAYRRAETDLMAAVRSAYFAVLVSREGMKANRALIELTDEVYKVILVQLTKGQVAGYEPAQVSVYAGQARVAYIQSRNSYLQSWKNLATAIGLSMMPATELSGSVTRDLPRFDFEKGLAHILKNHTDALTALNGFDKARFGLRLAQVTPVPDVTVGAGLIYDATPPGPTRLVPMVTASLPVPFFDRNQGGIRQAQAAQLRAAEEPHRVQMALTASFADAYRRLEENRQILELYYKQLLPQQIQAFRATVKRHFIVGPVEVSLAGSSTSYLTDMIAAEQNVVGLVGSYLTALGAYWQAASDTASLLQTDDVYEMAAQVTNLPEADLTELLRLPCCHPCSSVPAAPGVQPPTGMPAAPHIPALPHVDAGMPTLGAPTFILENHTAEAVEGGTR
jgi:cobalt-zinc-cadmium efflux system outer membrane protein